ncbi:MotE family protein [Gracilibacillus sp. D59]|uniref:MotE family protein n=1 Tax=Gracilibacillus sp. D59 TaxID=3457434 RepID=UPI003FCE86EC
MATNLKKSKENKASVFQWLIVIFVPLIFALVFAVIILHFMGVDTGKYTKDTLNKVPFISEQVTTDGEELHANQLAEKDQVIKKLQEEVDALQHEVQTKEGTISELEEKNSTMSSQIGELEEAQQSETTNSGSLEELAASFKAMKPKAAAPIIETMEDDVAIPLLQQLDAEVRGEILSEMDPETAATYSDLLVNQ